MPQPIQLPTSTALLLDQLFRAYQFTKHFDPRHPGPTAVYPEFLAKFDKEAELDRLSFMAEALANGANVAIHVDQEIVDALHGV